jgi:segregation and condensation protein B
VSRRGKRESDPAELEEEELIAELRRRAWAFLSRRPSPPLVVEDAPAPANDASPESPPAKPPRKARPRDQTDPVTSLRRKAWWWLRPKLGAQQAAEALPPPKRRRAKREPAPDAVTELRRRSWEWFSPRAQADAGAKANAPHAAELPGGEIVRAHLKGVLEAVVFASEHPLPAKDLARIAGAELRLVKTLLAELMAEYQPRGVRLDEIAGGFVFRTSPAFAPFVREQVAKKPVKMTRAQIETLAIVAYRQPITRPEIDDVRGVDSGAVLKSLLEREVVRMIGKKDEPGRPILYGTTATFLELFGLKALADLPTLREFTELTDESKRTYEREMSGLPEQDSGLMGGEGSLKTPEQQEPSAGYGGLPHRE